MKTKTIISLSPVSLSASSTGQRKLLSEFRAEMKEVFPDKKVKVKDDFIYLNVTAGLTGDGKAAVAALKKAGYKQQPYIGVNEIVLKKGTFAVAYSQSDNMWILTPVSSPVKGGGKAVEKAVRPPYVLGVQEWESYSYRLEDQLFDTLKASGIHITFVDGARVNYKCIAVSTKKLSKADIKKIEQNIDLFLR